MGRRRCAALASVRESEQPTFFSTASYNATAVCRGSSLKALACSTRGLKVSRNRCPLACTKLSRADMRPSWAEEKELEAEDFIVITKRLPTGPLPRPYEVIASLFFAANDKGEYVYKRSVCVWCV